MVVKSKTLETTKSIKKTVESLKMIEVSLLKVAKWNPAIRQKDLGSLVESIEKVGLLQPILVTDKLEVIDGHMRLNACKKAGMDFIPCLIAKGNQAQMFAEVNSTSKRLTGNQNLQVYLKEPDAVASLAFTRISGMEKAVGRQLVERLAKEGFSMDTYNVALKVAKEADAEDQVVMLLKWIMKFRCSRIVTKALAFGTPPSKILAAAKNSKPLRVSYVA